MLIVVMAFPEHTVVRNVTYSSCLFDIIYHVKYNFTNKVFVYSV